LFALQINPFKFAGGYLDSATNLYKFGTRYDDPTLGRWTQQDPVGGSLGDLNSANRYTYADDNPVNLTDPSGMDAVDCAATILLSILAVVGFAVAVAIIAATLPESAAVLLGLSVADLSVIAAAVGYLSAQIGVGLALFHGACG
jgi:RHS repeat-associated protein